MHNIPQIRIGNYGRFYSVHKRNLTYISILLFSILVIIASYSINNYINLSLKLLTPVESSSDTEQVLKQNVVVTVKSGDTLYSILTKQNIAHPEIRQIITLVKKQQPKATQLAVGQKLLLDYETDVVENEDNDLTSEVRNLTKIIVVIDKINSIEIIRSGDSFVAKSTAVPLTKVVAKSSAAINGNFILTLKSMGFDSKNISELVNAYSYQIDFQRQIHHGNQVTIIAEQFLNDAGEFSHHGKILYASIALAEKEYKIYRYSDNQKTNNNKQQLFFSPEGKSIKRNLLKTPVSIARISSRYGKRVHPTLGYSKMHRGIDFAAPEGTPIYAAGEGVITEIGWRSGYGRFIQIKHSANLSTAYAHAKSFAKNLTVGSRVKQGQVIAYVGSSGRATGPHLHYETKVAGKHINPMSIKTTPGIELVGKQLDEFKKFKNHIDNLDKKLDKLHYINISDKGSKIY